MGRCLSAEELDVLIAGNVEIDVTDWKLHSLYGGYTVDSPQVQWFWDWVHESDQANLMKLLAFATGKHN